jgi:hypothetical protein
MSLNDSVLFIISLLFLGFYYMIFNSDIFVESVLSSYPSLAKLETNGSYTPEVIGSLVIMLLIIVFYAATYLLLINLI